VSKLPVGRVSCLQGRFALDYPDLRISGLLCRARKTEPNLSCRTMIVRAGIIQLGVCALIVGGASTPAHAGPRGDEPVGLELIEERTESFANALLDLSVAVRDGEIAKVGKHFAPQVVANPFPTAVKKSQQVRKWIHSHGWVLKADPHRLQKTELLRSIEGFLTHFSIVEDVRFKVKKSVVQEDGSAIEARIAFWIIARDQAGHREWVRGWANASADWKSEGRFEMSRFVLESVDSMIAEVDLFDEVAAPAGLAATAPAFRARIDPPFAAYGVAVADVNNDGFVDLFVTGASGNSLYINQGDGTFRDQAEDAFVRELLHTGTGPLFLDYDNDGDKDLFVSSVGEQVLFENRLIPDGRLMFWDSSAAAGINGRAIGFTAVAGDVNKDGYPDIYVASYNRYGQILPDDWNGASNGTPNLLFVSQGDGTYKEAGAAWGVADGRWSYAAQFADFDADGDLDLYAANDFGGGNALYLNEGTRFVDVAVDRGVVDHGYCMGVSFGDYDNDGDLDLHVTRMSSTAGRRILARMSRKDLPQKGQLENLAAGNALYENVGEGFFRDVSNSAGPFGAGWAWGGGFFDLDNDGWLDTYTPNGFISGKSLKDT